MSLREDMWKYEQITGESAEHVPIIKLGAFLDGYEMGLKALEQQLCDIPRNNLAETSQVRITLEEAISTFEEWIERDKKIEYADRLENIEIYKQVVEWLIEYVDLTEAIIADKDTHILYVYYSKGYNSYLSPYYSENGKLCKYEDGKIIEVESEE